MPGEENNIQNEPKPLGSITNWAAENEKLLTALYGSTVQHSRINVRKDELEEIKITPPAEWGEDGEALVTLVTLGATMNPKYLENAKTKSSLGGSQKLDFNQSNLVSNVPTGDSRFLNKDFSDAMLFGRTDAAEAIAQYKNQNYEPIKTALKQVMEMVYSTAIDADLSLEIGKNHSPSYGLVSMGEKLLNAKLPFPLDEILPEAKRVKLEAAITMHKAHAETAEKLDILRKAPPDAGSPERERLVAQIVLGVAVMHCTNDEGADYIFASNQMLDEELEKYGIQNPQSGGGYENDYTHITENKSFSLNVMPESFRKNMLNNKLGSMEYFLSRPNAEQQLEEITMKQIKSLPLYQELLSEQDPKKLQDAISGLHGRLLGAGGLKALVPKETLEALNADEKKRELDAEYELEYKAEQERIQEYIHKTVERFEDTKELISTLDDTAAGLNDAKKNTPELAKLKAAVTQLRETLDDMEAPSIHSDTVQRALHEVDRLATDYTKSVRDAEPGNKDANWVPSSKTERAAYRAAQSLGSGLAKYEVAIPVKDVPEPKRVFKVPGRGMTESEERRILQSMELFDAIPETNTDKAIDNLLASEEKYRAEHVLDQDETMASAVRSMTLLAAKKRFAPKPGEAAAETARRHRAMKEALAPEQLMSNMLKLYINMQPGSMSPIAGVTLKNGFSVVQEAINSGNLSVGGATTQDLADVMEDNIVEIEPYVDGGMEQVSFYEESAEFEKKFLSQDKPLPEESIQAYATVQQSFKALNDTLEPFYQRDENGELPKLTEQDFAKIRDGYQNVLTELRSFSRQASQSGHPIDNGRWILLDQFGQKLGEDIIALEAGKQLGMSTLPNILLNANLPMAEIESNPKWDNSALDTRLPVNLLGNDGKQVRGFFTPAKSVSDIDKEALSEALERETAGHPEWSAFIGKAIERDDWSNGPGKLNNLSWIVKLEEKMARRIDQSDLFDEYFAEQNVISGNEYNTLRSHEFSMAMYRVIREHAAAKGLLNSYLAQGLDSGSLDKRGSAMTTMADMMGMPSIVAASKSVKIKLDGQEVVGTFMALTEGADLAETRPGDPLSTISVDDVLTPESVSSLADLQTLDFICGNVDRQLTNMTYQIDTSELGRPRCVGVQGVGNDFSFCKNAKGGYMADIMNMKIIRKDTAEKLFSMKPEMIKTVLGGYDLSTEEINAAMSRIGKLKEAVNNQTIRVVTDEEIKTMNYATELATGSNYFTRMTELPEMAKNYAFKSDDKDMDKAYAGLRGHTDELAAGYSRLEDVNRGKFIGSSAFRTVKKGMKDLAMHREELLKDGDPQKLELYAAKLEKLNKDSDKYLGKKEAEEKKSKPSALAKRRTNAVKTVRESVAKELKNVREYLRIARHKEAMLRGTNEEAYLNVINNRQRLEKDVWYAKNSAQEMFQKLEGRNHPLLAQVGKTLKEEARIVMEEAYQPETPEIRERRVRLYAGIVADRMLQKQLEKKGGNQNALAYDAKLFEKTREAVMRSPGFDAASAETIHRGLHESLGKSENLERAVANIEEKRMSQAKGPMVQAQEKKAEKQPEKETGKKVGGMQA